MKGFLTQTRQTNVFSTRHTDDIYKNRNFEFNLTYAFLKNVDKKKKTQWWYFTKKVERAYFGIFKVEFLMSTTKVVTHTLLKYSKQ